MEDPWGSPWTNESPPKIDLPAPPPNVHVSLENNNHTQRRPSPARSPWEDEDAWGGWNDAASSKESDVWRRKPSPSPSLRPASAAISRLPSPSPWATFGTLGEEQRVAKEVEKPRTSIEVESTDAENFKVDVGDDLRQDEAPVEDAGPDLAEPAEETKDPWDKEDHASPKDTLSSPKIIQAKLESVPQPSPVQAPEAEDSAKPSRQGTKVLELVDHYDGIARRSVSPAPPPKASPSEDVVREILALDDTEQSSASSEESDLEGSEQDEPAQAVQDQSQNELEMTEKPQETMLSSQPHIDIEVDMGKLDELFPSVDTRFPAPEPVPDVIIDDTFANISERKTWYRISRYGSIRKHDHGDDENYVTVTWPHTEIRGQVIRIVRRWMEEDSMGGRTVLGRRAGAAGASMFNWNSRAPQVEIGELLAKKSGHSRDLSLSSKATEPSPTVPAFSWSQAQPSSPTGSAALSAAPLSARSTAARALGPHPDRSPDKARFSLPAPPKGIKSSFELHTSVKANERPSSLYQTTAAPIIPPTQVAPTDESSGGEKEEESEDDEWGDMVSSSAVADNQGLANGSAKDALMPEKTEPANALLSPSKTDTKDDTALLAENNTLQSARTEDFDDFGAFEESQDSSLVEQTTEPSKSMDIGNKDMLQNVDPGSSSAPTSVPESQGKSVQDVTGDERAEEIVADMLRNVPDLSYMLR